MNFFFEILFIKRINYKKVKLFYFEIFRIDIFEIILEVISLLNIKYAIFSSYRKNSLKSMYNQMTYKN